MAAKHSGVRCVEATAVVTGHVTRQVLDLTQRSSRRNSGHPLGRCGTIGAGADPAQAAHVLGVQANAWVEYIPTAAHLDYMLFPRLRAPVDNAWGAPNRFSGSSGYWW